MIASGEQAKPNSIIICESDREDVFSGDEELATKISGAEKESLWQVIYNLAHTSIQRLIFTRCPVMQK